MSALVLIQPRSGGGVVCRYPEEGVLHKTTTCRVVVALLFTQYVSTVGRLNEYKY